MILPGAAYTEKPGTYVNTEGRVQRSARAVQPPGEARDDWRILRAFSQHVGHTLPYDDLTAVRARLAEVNPAFARVDELARYACTDNSGPIGDPTALSADPFVPLIENYYRTDPISRASITMAACTDIIGNQPALAAE